ncbi:MAG: lipoyl(octanoyl) transferase LipB [Tepidisphaeraceae bacterium]|jgi:lipoyl(octanoyl) transferase
MRFIDLGTSDYRPAWALQEAAVEEVAAGAEERVFLVEHTPVITLGRRAGLEKNVLAGADYLAGLGVDVVHSDRGGDVTFHGPGQLVVYPIIRLIDRKLTVGGYVRRMQEIVVATLADLDIASQLDPSAVGVWTRDGDRLAKICALGVRVRRGITMHGIALNVATDLRYFDLINPCGLGRPVTSIQRVLGTGAPGMERVKEAVRRRLAERLDAAG